MDGEKFFQFCERIIEWLCHPICCSKRKRNSKASHHVEEMHSLTSKMKLPLNFSPDRLIDPDKFQGYQDISIQSIDNLSLSQIMSFLSLEEIEKLKQINKKFYNHIKSDEFLTYYASKKYGHFFKSRENLNLALKALNLFYHAWNETKRLADKAPANLEQSTQFLFSRAFENFQLLFEKKNCEWTSIYLAIMLHKGYGTKKDDDQLRRYIEVLKTIWIEIPDDVLFKNNEAIRIVSSIILENYFSNGRYISDKEFYDQHLNVLNFNIKR